jgi:peptidoglycan/xylan/chitin deacetylase (PgdA/CDA1 family)
MTAARLFLRAAGRRMPLKWLERLGLVCTGIVIMLHEVLDDSAADIASGTTAGFLNTLIGLLRADEWDIVTIDQALRRLARKDTARRYAVLTFDDGYRDTVTRALPILERWHAPFTVYVPTGAPTRELYSWWLGVRALFERHEKVIVVAMHKTFSCGNLESKMRGYREVVQWVHQDYRRASGLDETFRRYGIVMAELNDACFMDETQLRALARHPLATIGAHTASHVALSTYDADRVQREMSDNRRYLEGLTERPVRHLAYPYGTPLACGPREFELAADAGFQSAVTTRYGPLFVAHARHLHALPRIAPARADAANLPRLLRSLRNAVRDVTMPLP